MCVENPELSAIGLVSCSHDFRRVLEKSFLSFQSGFMARVGTMLYNLLIHCKSQSLLVSPDNVFFEAMLQGHRLGCLD